MITRSYPRCAILVTILFLSESSLIGEEPTLDDAWELSRRYQFNEAVKAFSDKDDTTPPSVAAEAHFGLAVNLINRQPKTRANIERARRILEGLLAAEPESDLGIAARYFLGRIAQLHLQKPDIESAIEHFGYLVEHHPDNFWGQVAATVHMRGTDPVRRSAPRGARGSAMLPKTTCRPKRTAAVTRARLPWMAQRRRR